MTDYRVKSALLLALSLPLAMGCKEGKGSKGYGTLVVTCRTKLWTDYTTLPEAWPRAYVSVSSVTSKTQRRVESDVHGVARFERLPAGAYRIRVDRQAKPDEVFANDTLSVRDEDTTRVTFTLERIDLLTPKGPYGETRIRRQ